MLIAVVDTETTDVTPEAQMVEMAIVWVDETGKILDYHSSLVKPTEPISIEAMATHHITEEMVRDEDPAEIVLEKFRVIMRVARWDCGTLGDVMAAHNLAFDDRVLRHCLPEEFLPSRKICTWKCARHLWPDAPSYKNQVLRYWRRVDIPEDAEVSRIHRALPDAIVTSAILADMLRKNGVEELIRLTHTPVVLKVCRFGSKHYGKLWSDIPKGYLHWMLDNCSDLDEDTLHTVLYHLGRITL